MNVSVLFVPKNLVSRYSVLSWIFKSRCHCRCRELPATLNDLYRWFSSDSRDRHRQWECDLKIKLWASFTVKLLPGMFLIQFIKIQFIFLRLAVGNERRFYEIKKSHENGQLLINLNMFNVASMVSVLKVFRYSTVLAKIRNNGG